MSVPNFLLGKGIPLTVKRLTEILSELPENALVRAYEGEITGIVVESTKNECDIAFIETK